MSFLFKEVSSVDEYQNLVQEFSYLVDKELSRYEEENDVSLIVQHMPTLISLVNTIGYFRGQDGAFLDFRPPDVTSLQVDLYKNENDFEKRLNTLIKKILASPHSEAYKRRLEMYFITSRINQ